MSNRNQITLTKKDLVKIDSGAYRQALVELGMYSIPTHKVHNNKKKYNRKLNQNKRWDDNV